MTEEKTELEKGIELGKEIQEKIQENEELKEKIEELEKPTNYDHLPVHRIRGSNKFKESKLGQWFNKQIEKHGLGKLMILVTIYIILGFVGIKIVQALLKFFI